MSRNTRSNKRSLTQETEETVKSKSKRVKTGKNAAQPQDRSNERRTSRSPKVNKPTPGLAKSKIGRKVIVKGSHPSMNNNAKPMETEDEVIRAHSSKTDKLKSNKVTSTPVQRDSQDTVRVEVDPADDNFAEDEIADSPYNQETESDSNDEAESEFEQGVEFDPETSVQNSTLNDSEISFGKKTLSQDELSELVENPSLQRILQGMVEQRVKQVMKEVPKDKETTKVNTGETFNRIKSPSDTTIYAPALKLTPECSGNIIQGVSGRVAVDQVAQFVDNIRLETEQAMNAHDPTTVGVSGDDRAPVKEPSLGTSSTPADRAKEEANRQVIEAERMKLNLDPPPGRYQLPYSDVVDDEFFHITCHVDQALMAKIQLGQFVELEKLLIKDRPFTKNSENRLGMYSKDGVMYFAPAEKEQKIGNVRKWEQALRVYTAIYSKANPERAAEIWQYVYVINSAAASYHWDNVAEYDFTFRQLMGTYPARSWAKTYLQAWNLCMRDPLNRNVSNYSNQQKTNSNRDNNCWLFNKGKCNDKNCTRGDHQCSYCGKWGHGMHVCCKCKKAGKGDGQSGSNETKASNRNHGAEDNTSKS